MLQYLLKEVHYSAVEFYWNTLLQNVGKGCRFGKRFEGIEGEAEYKPVRVGEKEPKQGNQLRRYGYLGYKQTH